jgi:hypothetical protein
MYYSYRPEKSGGRLMRFKTSFTAFSVSMLFALSMPLADGATKVKALEVAGPGFSLTSDEFGDPCSSIPGNYPVLYQNFGSNDVDVSIKLVNLGTSILFIDGTGIVIPPLGNQARPRIMRFTLEPGEVVRVKPQTSGCAWAANVLPH